MSRLGRYSHSMLLFVSLFVMIWSAGVIRDNHNKMVGLVDSYSTLVDVYAVHDAPVSTGSEVDDRINYLQSEIKQQLHGDTGVRLNLKPYFLWLLLGLAGIALSDWLRGRVRSRAVTE